jgi:hypothetical protein
MPFCLLLLATSTSIQHRQWSNTTAAFLVNDVGGLDRPRRVIPSCIKYNNIMQKRNELLYSFVSYCKKSF